MSDKKDYWEEEVKNEILQTTSLKENELNDFFQRRLALKGRTAKEVIHLLSELNAKALRQAQQTIFKNGLKVIDGEGYYSTISEENSQKIDDILSDKIKGDLSLNNINNLDSRWFIPEIIVVDRIDLRKELSEVIHGILRHEIGEVLFNRWDLFITSQIKMEETCQKAEMGNGWGKEYGLFINAIGDPRINYFSSLISREAEKDILYAEFSGVIGLLDEIKELSVNQQFLMLANCREVEKYSPILVELIKKQAHPEAVRFYHKFKKELEQISRTRSIDKFYQKANKIWSHYTKLLPEEGPQKDQYERVLVLLPMPGGSMLYNEKTDILIPLPGNVAKRVKTLPNIVVLVTSEDRKEQSDKLDKQKLEEISGQIEINQQKMDNQSLWEKSQALFDENMFPELREGFGIQEKKGDATNKSQRVSVNYQQIFAPVQQMSSQFRRALCEFMPKEGLNIHHRKPSGYLNIRDVIDTMGASQEVHLRSEKQIKYYGIFSVIIDNSGSTIEESHGRKKLDYFKEVGYALCDAFSDNGIPFELMNFDFPIQPISPFHSMEEFSVEERDSVASMIPEGGQADAFCLSDSATRLIPFAKENNCTPFFIIICDGCTDISLKYTVDEIRKQMAIVIGVGVMLPEEDKFFFSGNFGNHGILVDEMNTLVPQLVGKLKTEVQRLKILKG